MRRTTSACLAAALAAAAVAFAPASGAVGSSITCGAVVTSSLTLSGDLNCISQPGPALTIGAHGLVLDLGGHTISGTRYEGETPYYAGVVENTGFDDVTIRNGRVSADAMHAVALDGGADRNTIVRVSGNSLSNVIDVRDSVGTVVDGVSGWTDNHHVVRLLNSSAATVRNVRNSDGILLQDTSDSLVTGNSIGYSDAGGIVVRGDGNHIEGNTVGANSDAGIRVDGGTGNVVTGNTATGAYYNVVVGEAATSTTVSGNTTAAAESAGILVEDGSIGTVLDGNSATAGAGDGVRIGSAATTVRGNTATGNSGWGITSVAGVTDGGDNTAYDNAAGDCAGVTCSAPLVGTPTVGASWTLVTANSKRASRFVAQAPLTVRTIRVYLDGKGGAKGSQAVRGVLYTDAAGSPGQRMAVTATTKVAAGTAAGWVALPLAQPLELTAGTAYWLGLHSGTTAKVARYAGTSEAGALRWNTDAFSDGATPRFGTTNTAGKRISVYASGG